MNQQQKSYYHKMLEKERGMPIIIGDRFAAYITFYITNNEHEYDNVYPWAVLEDDSNGRFCYIAQMLTDKNKDNYKFSFRALKSFSEYIKEKFPLVRMIYWRRWDEKNSIVRIYKKEI